MTFIKQYIKQSIFFILSCLQLFVFSQVPMEKVLVEMGTATWSSACAAEVQMIEQMKADDLQISVINYHLNDPFANQYANQRASFYSIQNLPFPLVGGQEVEIGNYSSYNEKYTESINTLSAFEIAVSGHFSEDTLIMDLSIDKVASYESDLISMYLVLTESDIEMDWHGLTEVDDVERDMSPDGNGQSLDFSNASNLNYTKKILFSRNWNPEKMDIVVFIQNDTGKKVLQCHSQPVPDFAPLPVHAFFQVADTIACVNESIAFQNLSTGDVENVHWIFNGGTPNQSTDYHPNIQYETEGVFTVSLAVSNSISTDTLIIEEFMNIQALPSISFNPLPDFCSDQDYYKLIEGNPSGGQYFGLFVDTGYFFPVEAGIGDHSIFYSIQDEETGCSDTLSQNAFVYVCESVGEQIPNNNSISFILSKENNQYHLQQNQNPVLEINSIRVYSLSGQLISESKFRGKAQKIYDFSVMSNNPYLIIHVLSGKKVFVIKYSN